MKKIVMSVAVLMTLLCVAGAERWTINGAFGWKLGDRLPDDTELKAVNEEGTLYRFRPEQPFREYTRYYLEITPKTRLIYSISTSQAFDNKEASELEIHALIELLRKRYPRLKPAHTSFGKSSLLVFGEPRRSPKRKISIYSETSDRTDKNPYYVGLTYKDVTLEEQAKKEAGREKNSDSSLL